MTREDAKSCIGTIEMLQRLAYNIHGIMNVIDADNCKKIIKALEQEPCGDAVSRKAVKDKLIRLWNTSADEDYKFETLRDYIVDLPSVTPKPKTDVLGKIRAEIDIERFIDKDTKLCKNANASGLEVALQIIDKYKAESGE